LILEPNDDSDNIGKLMNQLTGSSRFVDEVEKRLEQRIEQRGHGRPGVWKEITCKNKSIPFSSHPSVY